MKSTVTIFDNVPQFPALYKHNRGGFVVLFASLTTGVVVGESESHTFPCSQQKIGAGSGGNNVWHSCYDTTEWTRLPAGSEVKLIQE